MPPFPNAPSFLVIPTQLPDDWLQLSLFGAPSVSPVTMESGPLAMVIATQEMVLSAILLNSVAAPLAGPLGNWADRAIVGSVRKLAETLAGTQTPKNHDVLKATHGAWVESIRVMAQLCDDACQNVADREAHRAFVKVVKSQNFAIFRYEGDNLPLNSLNALIDGIYNAWPDTSGATTDIAIAALDAMMRTEKLTQNLRDVFYHGYLGKRGWAATFQLFFSETVKENRRVFHILAIERLNEIVAACDAQSTEIAHIRATLADFWKAVAEQLPRMEGKLDKQSVSLAALTSHIDGGQELDEKRHAIVMAAFSTLEDRLEKLALGENEQNQRLERVEAEVAKAIDRDPTLTGGDVVSQVVNLISSRENALRELASIPPEDNRVRSFQAAAEEAIASSDNAGALLALQEARSAIDGRRESDARLSAKYAAAQAELLLGEGEWQEADLLWYEAGALLEPFDFDAAEDIYRGATKKLFNFGENFANPDALVRAYLRCKRLLEISDADSDPKKWADRAIFLSVILSDVSSLSEDDRTISMRQTVLSALIKVFEIINPVRDYEQWIKATCTLGTLYALQAERLRVSGDRDSAYIIAKNAAETFEIALSALTDDADSEQRAQIACCIGNACLIQGEAADTQQKGVEILSKSMRALQYADSLVTEKDHPKVWATVQMHAGSTLMAASPWVEKELRAKLAFDAVTAIRASLRIYSEFKTPNDWAQAKCFLGGALMSICRRSEGPDWDKIKQEGLEAFGAALRVWNVKTNPYGYEVAMEGLAKLSAMTSADVDD